MKYAFILLLLIPSLIVYAGCKSGHNATPDQKSAAVQQQKPADAGHSAEKAAIGDSLKDKQVPEMPVVILRVPPVYPDEARKNGIQGEVQVQILVGADGSVKEAKVIKNESGAKDLEKAALEAVNKWKFEPGKLNGKSVEVNVIIPIRFKLQEEKKQDEKK